MKTLTEFSPLLLRTAAAARAAAGGARSAPQPSAEAPATVGDGEAAQAGAGEAAEAAAGEARATAPEGAEAPADGGGAAEGGDAKPDQDPAIDAVASALGVQPERAARLLEALDIIGDHIDQVRLVRVFQGEKGPQGAISRGEFHYVIDRIATPHQGRRNDRGERRGGRGGGFGFGGGRGDRDRPRGLGSLKAGAPKEERRDDDRPGRGEMPRAGIGWQLTAAPRDFGDRGRGGRRGPGRGRGPGGRGRGPGRPGGPGGPRGPRPQDTFGQHGGPGEGGFMPGFGPGENNFGPEGTDAAGGPSGREGRRRRRGRGRGPRPQGPGDQASQAQGADAQPASEQAVHPPQQPRLGPDGQPLPPRSKRPRKPIGPDENGLGPDGTPWDPERRAKRLAERQARSNTSQAAPVEAQAPSVPAETPSESPTE